MAGVGLFNKLTSIAKRTQRDYFSFTSLYLSSRPEDYNAVKRSNWVVQDLLARDIDDFSGRHDRTRKHMPSWLSTAQT